MGTGPMGPLPPPVPPPRPNATLIDIPLASAVAVAAPPVVIAPPIAPIVATPVMRAPRSSGRGRTFVLLGVLGVLVLGMGGFYLWLKRSGDDEGAATSANASKKKKKKAKSAEAKTAEAASVPTVHHAPTKKASAGTRPSPSMRPTGTAADPATHDEDEATDEGGAKPRSPRRKIPRSTPR